MSDAKKDETQPVSDAEIVEEKGGGSNKLLFIMAPILIIVGVIAGVFLTPMVKGLIGGDKQEKSEKTQEKKGEESGESAHVEESAEPSSSKEPLDPKKMAFIPVPDVLVNLKGDRKSRPTFLKVSIVLQVHDGHHAKEVIEPFVPKVVDQMQLFLRDLDINDVSGANNLQRLRRELLMRVNNVMAPNKVDDVLIKEFLIQ